MSIYINIEYINIDNIYYILVYNILIYNRYWCILYIDNIDLHL